MPISQRDIKDVEAELGQLKLVTGDDEINLTSTFSDVVSVSGSGSLQAFSMELDSDKIEVKVVSDGNDVFTMDCELLDDMANDSNAINLGLAGFITWHKGKKLISFDSKSFCFSYESSFKIQARETSGNRKIERFLCWYLED